jgi:hypothetical protein
MTKSTTDEPLCYIVNTVDKISSDHQLDYQSILCFLYSQSFWTNYHPTN